MPYNVPFLSFVQLLTERSARTSFHTILVFPQSFLQRLVIENPHRIISYLNQSENGQSLP